jgi:hypothetical protein
MNRRWLFGRKTVAGFEAPGYDDSNWEKIRFHTQTCTCPRRILKKETFSTFRPTATLALAQREAKEGQTRWSGDQAIFLESARGLVGAGRFERPNPAQGIEALSRS